MLTDTKTIIVNNDIGPKLTIEIQLRYEDLLTLKLPESCTRCPIGFAMKSNGDCGRNHPLELEDYTERPDTCKLKQLKINLNNILETGELQCLII